MSVKISEFYQDTGITTVTLEHPKKSDISPITLTFENNPFELKQWKIIDPQSVEVTVSIYDIVKDEEIPADMFRFKKAKSNPMKYKNKK